MSGPCSFLSILGPCNCPAAATSASVAPQALAPPLGLAPCPAGGGVGAEGHSLEAFGQAEEVLAEPDCDERAARVCRSATPSGQLVEPYAVVANAAGSVLGCPSRGGSAPVPLSDSSSQAEAKAARPGGISPADVTLKEAASAATNASIEVSSSVVEQRFSDSFGRQHIPGDANWEPTVLRLCMESGPQSSFHVAAWTAVAIFVASAVTLLKVVVDSSITSGADSWLWCFTSSISVISWWWSITSMWDICRPGLPRWTRAKARCFAIVTSLVFRLWFLICVASSEGNMESRISLCFLPSALELVLWDMGSYVLIPLVWTRCSDPVKTDHGIRSTAQIAPVLALCFVMLSVGWGAEVAHVIIADARHPAVWLIEGACYAFIVPLVLLALCNRWGLKWCRVSQGQHTGYAICMTVMMMFPIIVASIFFTLHGAVEHKFQNDTLAQGLAQSGVLLFFQVMMVVAAFAWDLVARQVMEHAKYLERPVLLFPLIFTQALFLQCFLLSTVFLSPQYFMQLIAMTISRAALQSGLVPVMKWFFTHQAMAAQNSAGDLQSGPSSMAPAAAGVLATGGVMSIGIVSNTTPASAPGGCGNVALFSAVEPATKLKPVISDAPFDHVLSDREECVQEGTLHAVLSLHNRQLAVTSFAQLASNAAMLTCVCAEVAIFELQGQPECCEVSPTSEVGAWSCFGRSSEHVLRDGLGAQCPRYTARHTRSGRHVLMLHFLANIASLFAAAWLGSGLFRTLSGWAKRRAPKLQTTEEELLQPIDIPDLRSAATYLLPYTPYLLSTLASVVIVTFTQIRRLQWGQ